MITFLDKSIPNNKNSQLGLTWTCTVILNLFSSRFYICLLKFYSLRSKLIFNIILLLMLRGFVHDFSST